MKMNLNHNLALPRLFSAQYKREESGILPQLPSIIGMLILLGGALWIVAAAGILLTSWWQSSSEYSTYLWKSDGWRLTTQTLWLAAAVLLGCWITGGTLAFITTLITFPGRKLATILALVPLAIPSYVMGFVWLSWFDYTGPLQSLGRELFAQESWNILGSGFVGLTLSMTLSLFSYTYVLVRLRLQSLDRSMIEAARSLGLSPRSTLLRIMMPLLWPAFLASGFLVLMEVISDFGTVAIFSYDTFTTAIFKAWYGFFDLWGALQLASLLWVVAWMIYGCCQSFRLMKKNSTQNHSILGEDFEPLTPLQLSPFKQRMVAVGVFTVLALAVLLPLLTLVDLALGSGGTKAWPQMIRSLWHSAALAGTATILVLAVSMLALSLSRSRSSSSAWRWVCLMLTRLLSLGYAFPGAVLAVALFAVVTSLERWNIGIHLASTLPFLLGAMVLYVLAVGLGALTQGYDKIPRELDESSVLLGVRGWQLWRKVHWPLLHYPLLFGGLLVFVDVLKEMPITLMLRPLSWSPLTVKIYEWTSEGEWGKAAAPSLAIVAISSIALIGFLRTDKLSERIPWIRIPSNK